MGKKKSKEQRTPGLRTRAGSAQGRIRQYTVKSEILQFRLDEDTYKELHGIAKHERKPIGTLVREWITGMVKEEAVDYKPIGRKQLVSRQMKITTGTQRDSTSERAQRLKSINELMEFRRTMPKIPLKELLEARHKGHKY